MVVYMNGQLQAPESSKNNWAVYIRDIIFSLEVLSLGLHSSSRIIGIQNKTLGNLA